MPPWTGFFDNSGTPCLRIWISGPFAPAQEFDAVLDTGFAGFLSMPLVRAFPLGLMLHGITDVVLADGSVHDKLAAKATITVDKEARTDVAILEPGSNEVLVGIDFLRIFKRILLLDSGRKVELWSRADFDATFGATPQQPPRL